MTGTHGDQVRDLLCVKPSQLHGGRPRTDVNDAPVPARKTKKNLMMIIMVYTHKNDNLIPQSQMYGGSLVKPFLLQINVNNTVKW